MTNGQVIIADNKPYTVLYEGDFERIKDIPAELPSCEDINECPKPTCYYWKTCQRWKALFRGE